MGVVSWEEGSLGEVWIEDFIYWKEFLGGFYCFFLFIKGDVFGIRVCIEIERLLEGLL